MIGKRTTDAAEADLDARVAELEDVALVLIESRMDSCKLQMRKHRNFETVERFVKRVKEGT